MKKTVIGLVAAAAFVGLASVPAKADVIYIDSNGMSHNLSSTIDVTTDVMPVTTTIDRTLVSPAVIEPMPLQTHIITSPAVVAPTTVTQPVVIDRVDDHRGLLHFGLWPLIDFSLF